MSSDRNNTAKVPCYQEVKPKDIRASLTKIKQHLGSFDGAGKNESTHVRVMLSNVIILSIANEQQSSEYYHTLINSLSASHPSRFFVVEYNCAADMLGKPLKTAVGVRSVTVKTGAETVTEELYLTVSGDQVKVVPNLLLSHLAPEVPIVTILLNDPRQTEQLSSPEEKETHSLSFKSLLISMEELSDVVIYDSSNFSNFRKGINALLAFKKILLAKQSTEISSIGRPLNGGSQVAELRDISWRRTKRWRSLIAEHFDGELGESLPKSINGLTFVYQADKEDDRLSGDILLTASWILNALSLKAEEAKLVDGVIKVTCRTIYGTEVAVDFTAQRELDSLRDNSTLRAVTLQFAEEANQTSLSFRTISNHSLCEVVREKIATGKKPQQLYSRRVSFSDSDNNQLVLEELSSPVRDTIYREVRDGALELAKLVKVL